MNTSITRIVLPALGAAGLALASLGALPAQAADSAQRGSVDVCEITVASVKANDLQEPGLHDETFARLGDTDTTARTYTDNQKRNTRNDGDDTFTGSERVKLIERDGGVGNNDVIGSATLPCDNDTGEAVLVEDRPNGAIYTITYEVDVLP